MPGTTGDPIYPGSALFPGAAVYPGQGARVVYVLLVSFDDASNPYPTWVDISSRLRAFGTARGRATELADVDAGTGVFTLDNRDRAFDPANSSSPYYPNLRAMNRLWYRAQFAGQTYELLKGYVESYEQQWPQMVDAVTIVNATDEFKVLSLSGPPTTDPPRETYADVVMFDNPAGYWPLNDNSTTLTAAAAVGPSFANVTGNQGSGSDGAIAGAADPLFSYLILNAANYMETDALPGGQGPELGGLTGATIECWVRADSNLPSVNDDVLRGPNAGVSQWVIRWLTTGQMRILVNSDDLTVKTATSADVVPAGQWIHVVGVVDGSTLRIYINGVQAGTGAFAGQIRDEGTGVLRIGDSATTQTYNYDEFAIYRTALSASRIAAHYTAGTARGFRPSKAGERIDRILDAASNRAPRDIDTGIRVNVDDQYAGNGQPAIEAIRRAENAEAADAFVFVAGDGTVTFRDADHRSDARYTTDRMLFGDQGGTQRAYQDLVLDYSDSFIANEWNVTRNNGLTQTSSDTTSIARYFKRSQSLTDLLLTSDSASSDIATAMLAKYKEPLLRVTQIQPKMNDINVAQEVFTLELGDRIRVIRNPPGGGAAFDQQLYVQRIEISGDASTPFYPKVVLGVSPV